MYINGNSILLMTVASQTETERLAKESFAMSFAYDWTTEVQSFCGKPFIFTLSERWFGRLSIATVDQEGNRILELKGTPQCYDQPCVQSFWDGSDGEIKVNMVMVGAVKDDVPNGTIRTMFKLPRIQADPQTKTLARLAFMLYHEAIDKHCPQRQMYYIKAPQYGEAYLWKRSS